VIDAATVAAVAKSGLWSSQLTCPPCTNAAGGLVTTFAPLGMMPTVAWFLRNELFAPLRMLKPPIETGPCASA